MSEHIMDATMAEHTMYLMTRNARESVILRLPAEIRLMIYSYVFQGVVYLKTCHSCRYCFSGYCDDFKRRSTMCERGSVKSTNYRHIAGVVAHAGQSIDEVLQCYECHANRLFGVVVRHRQVFKNHMRTWGPSFARRDRSWLNEANVDSEVEYVEMFTPALDEHTDNLSYEQRYIPSGCLKHGWTDHTLLDGSLLLTCRQLRIECLRPIGNMPTIVNSNLRWTSVEAGMPQWVGFLRNLNISLIEGPTSWARGITDLSQSSQSKELCDALENGRLPNLKSLTIVVNDTKSEAHRNAVEFRQNLHSERFKRALRKIVRLTMAEVRIKVGHDWLSVRPWRFIDTAETCILTRAELLAREALRESETCINNNLKEYRIHNAGVDLPGKRCCEV